MKKFNEDKCLYVIHPLGKGIPLCLFEAINEKRLDKVLPRDLPLCLGHAKCKKLSKEERRWMFKEEGNEPL